MAEAVDLKGAMGLLKKSKNLLAPLFEAITNSFEAISEKTFSESEPARITANFYFTVTGLFNEVKNFSSVEVIDNGIGFNDTSFLRYKTLLDKSKGYKNRGSGRMQFLHRFGKVEISSIFQKGQEYYQRNFYSDENTLASDDNSTAAEEQSETGSKIALKNFKGAIDKESLDDITIENIQSAIKNKFLLKLYLDKEKPIQIEINFFKNKTLEKSVTVKADDIPAPTNGGELDVDYYKIENDDIFNEIDWIATGKKEKLYWVHWKLPEQDLSENGIFLCSKNVAIQPIPFLKIKKHDSIQGFRHLTAVYGDYLDRAENVNDAVDKFTIPLKKEVEKEAAENLFFDKDAEHIFIDDIEEQVKKVLPDIYTEVKELKEKQDHRVEFFAEMHGIPKEIAEAAKIKITDSDEEIVEKLYKKQAEEVSKTNFKIQKLYESLIDLSPNDTKYQDDLEKKGAELLELIPLQNKNELTRYVIRREMVTKILGLILKNSLAYQNHSRVKGERNDKEGLIHDLVFKRKSQNDGLNDLWILNEEFLHYSGHSDTPLNQIKLPDGSFLFPANIDEDQLLTQYGIKNRKTSRPDIFLFPEEGKCILVEFKAHDIDLSDHLNQLTKYCNLIANASTTKIESFYCYLVGEVVSRIDLPGEFTKTVYGDYVKANQPIRSVQPGQEETQIAQMYQEVVHLSNIEKRASIRNKSFADKLGIRLDEIPLDESISDTSKLASMVSMNENAAIKVESGNNL